MATARPTDLDQFAAINGVGPAKLKDYGKLFLDEIARHG
jgi:ATP-dependent DNA helicase RecQ